MTAPIQEPTEARTTSGLGYGQRQLFRRPGPASGEEPSIWGYIRWDDGAVLPDVSTSPFQWFKAPTFNQVVLSQDAVDTGVLFPDPTGNSNRLYVEAGADLDEGPWYTEIIATFDDNGTPPVVGDFFGIGNLIQSSVAWASEDVHGFQPATLLLDHAANHSFSVSATRIISTTTDFFFEGEVGCFTGGVDMWIDSIVLQVVKIGSGPEFVS